MTKRGATALAPRWTVPGGPAEASNDLEADLAASGERPVVASSSSGRPSYVGPRASLPELEGSGDCFGVRIAQAGPERLSSWFDAAVGARGICARTMVFADTRTMNAAWDDEDLREILGRMDVVLRGGLGLDVYGALAGDAFREARGRAELVLHLLASGPLRVFVYGGAPGVATEAARALEARLPNVRVVGSQPARERATVIEEINEACADVVLVGLGATREARWIEESKVLLDVGVIVGVGDLLGELAGVPSRPSLVDRVTAGPTFLARAIAHLSVGVRPRGS